MGYILKGDPREVAKVIQENRIRVDRGVIEFTPCQTETALDEDRVKTLVESHTAMGEERQRLIVDNLELADLAGLVVSIAVEGGQTIPGDIAGRLAKFGIIVPKISETAENTAEIGENLTESVPAATDSAPSESNHESSDAMDNKYVDVEDLQEVDLDADDKDLSGDDSKDVPADDAKEAAATKKKSTRSKKSK